MKELIRLFWAFFKIGALTFGGGYAMLPMMQKEIIEKNKWATEEEVLNYYAVSQCIPGAIAVNSATLIGGKRWGFWGAVFAALGVVAPSFMIILIIASFLQRVADLEIMQHALSGIRVGVAVLILQAVVRLWKTGVKDYFGIGLFALSFLLSAAFNLSPVIPVIIGVVAGIGYHKVKFWR